MSRSAYAAEALARGETAVLICTLWLQDRVVRVATRPVVVLEGDTVWSYEAGLLEVQEFAEEADYYDLSGVGTLQQAGIKLVLPESVAAAGLDDAWGWLLAGEAELAMVWEGQAWDERRVLVPRARLSMPKLGLANGALSATLETAALSDGELIGDAERDMGTDHPDLSFSSLDGTQFPIIIGKCYRIPGFKVGSWPGGGSEHSLILCGHKFGSDVGVGNFTIYEAGTEYTTPGGTITLEVDEDSTGVVGFLHSDSLADFDSAQEDFTVDCTAGALPGLGGYAMIRLDEIVAYLLRKSGETIDWERTRSALAFFSDWELGLYVDTATPALTLLRDRLLPWMPAWLQRGPDGVFLAHAAPWLRQPSFTLIDGQNCDLEQEVSIGDWSKIANHFTLSYFWDSSLGAYTKRKILGANHPLCRLSQQLVGLRAETELSCNACWSDATAAKILEARALRMALPRRKINAILDNELYWLEAGQVGTIESARLGLSRRRCYIRSIQPFSLPPEAVIELLPDTALEAGDL